ncbi:hypothetical protein [Streptomyces apocyni]|uniref:hypothetical protein n=1 Tax=Streptomyces apocyni TaxID=2654677 RepID=UPI0012E99729|nr:hypothetical protein [Streptomyces apocyni]
MRIVICCRCGREIKAGEPYERHVHDRATGAPLVNYSHRDRDGACPWQRPGYAARYLGEVRVCADRLGTVSGPSR